MSSLNSINEELPLRFTRGCFSAMLLLTVSGCVSNLLENRAIQRFADSLKSQDLSEMKLATSDDFSQRTLRSEQVFDDLKFLKIPEGKISIIKVDEEVEGRKRVTVEVGEKKTQLFYDLVRNDRGRWIVDDVYFKQKRQGVTAYKSISEQMDLLLTVREFQAAWETGTREDVLAVTSGDLQTILAELPPSWLARVTRIVSHRGKQRSSHPDAQMDETVAVVRIPRSSGEVILTMNREDDRWKITDLAVESRDESERIPSLLKQAVAINTCIQFLEAYEKQDRQKLETLCEKDFFNGSLAIGDLEQVQLPGASLQSHELQVQSRGKRVDFTLKGPRELVQISFHRVEQPPKDNGLSAPRFLVHDVTIFDIETKQQMQLSSLFTSKGMLELFVESAVTSDWQTVKHCATKDFSRRVWEPVCKESISVLPLGPLQEPIDEITRTTFEGALTIYDVKQGGQDIRYFLRQENGQFLIDDITLSVANQPESVKVTLECLLPVYRFARAIHRARQPEDQKLALEQLQRVSSTDFNRIIWGHTEIVPSSGLSADTFLTAPVRAIRLKENAGMIELGDQKFGAAVSLVREREFWVIDDVQLIAGVEAQDRLAMKHTLRTQMATGAVQKTATILPANHEVIVPDVKLEPNRKPPRQLSDEVKNAKPILDTAAATGEKSKRSLPLEPSESRDPLDP